MISIKITSSYSVKINNYTKILRPTVNIYRKAVSFFIDVINTEWESFSSITNTNGSIVKAEKLTHSTRNNPIVKYNFDEKFYKFPSYLRRAAIADAFGIVSSYKSNLANWKASGSKNKPPRLKKNHSCNPCFYYNNMFLGDCYGKTAKIKYFNGKDWLWLPINLSSQDIKYLQNKWSHCKPSAPILERKHGKNYLRFSFTEKVSLNKTPVEEQKIVSVDLGLNNNAVCSVIDAKGTVYSRKFINLKYEKDLLNHKLNKLKKFQRQHGSKNSLSRWSYINNLNNNISRLVAHQIVNFAVSNNADVLVFEYLDMKGSKHGTKAQLLSLWRKRQIQQIVEHQAHRNGIRFSRINPNGTSKYAYDGSGLVVRSNNNYSLCTFSNGKQYNCDLNASYNIGARYFIREILKPFSAMERSHLEAKVPSMAFRTKCTLATLISLNKVLAAPAA